MGFPWIPLTRWCLAIVPPSTIATVLFPEGSRYQIAILFPIPLYRIAGTVRSAQTV